MMYPLENGLFSDHLIYKFVGTILIGDISRFVSVSRAPFNTPAFLLLLLYVPFLGRPMAC